MQMIRRISKICLLLILFFYTNSYSTNYYSKSSIDASNPSNWNTARDGSGTDADASAFTTAGNIFIIQGSGNGGTTPHSMTTAANFTLAGAGTTLRIEKDAMLTNTFSVVTPILDLDSASTFVFAYVNSANGNTADIPGTDNWIFDAGSNFIIQKWGDGTGTNLAPLPGVQWGNLTINITSAMAADWHMQENISIVSGNFTLSSLGAGTQRKFIFANNLNFKVLFQGDLNILNSSILNFADGTGTDTNDYLIELGGNYFCSGTGVFAANVNANSYLDFNFYGDNCTFTNYGTFNSTDINLLVESQSTLTLGSNINFGPNRHFTIDGILNCVNFNVTGTGHDTLKNNNIITTTGNFASQFTGLQNGFSEEGTFIFNGSSQNIPVAIFNNVRINSGGAVLTGDMIVLNQLQLNGPLSVNSHTLTIYNPITINPANLTTNLNSSLVINGTASGIHIPSSVTLLNNLAINNNNIVTADGNISVRGILGLGITSGFLDMGTNTLEIGISASETGSLVRFGGSVRGKIKRWFASGSSAGKLFPLDNGAGAYSAATVSFSSLAAGGSLTASFNASGSGSLPGGYIYAPEMHVNIINLAPQYWTITADNGLSGGVYNLDIIGDALPNVGDYRYIGLLKRPDSGSDWAWTGSSWSETTGSNTNPVLHLVNVSSGFSDFGVGGNTDNLLPVELASFTSSVNANSVSLQWSTAYEKNNSHFDIERKTQEGSWDKKGSVQGNGTSGEPHSYSFNDKDIKSGKYFYRLKQVDYNGNFKYYVLSNEVVVGAPEKYFLSQNYPNPFNPATVISYHLPVAGFTDIKVYDITGKEVMTLVSEVQQAGYYNVTFNAAGLTSGIYFYKIQSGNFSQVKKAMLVK